jgi:glycosyltransferase involved in cell wall biosynthesis
MTFSIIIPSYNEGDDIRLAIGSAIAQTIKPLEVLVVDDSSDSTPEIIGEYSGRGVKLVNGERTGCCGARNLGMRQAKGDVVVLLNGDVQLPPDFLERISEHYESGADYVLVESTVLNPKDSLAAFVEAQGRLDYAHRQDLEWTEGFSARREAVAAVGYIPGDFAVRFCRDWMLGRRLRDAGFKKVIDRSIVVEDRAPASIEEYWRVRVARGRFGAFTQYYVYGKGRIYLAFKFLMKHIFRLIALLTLIYPMVLAIRLAFKSPRPISNIPPFFVAYFLQEVARAVGEWQGIFQAKILPGRANGMEMR